MTEVLLSEINRKPTEGTDRRLQREARKKSLISFHFPYLSLSQSYALAAGFALGLVTLGRGVDSVGLADLKIEEKLSTFIHGSTVRRNERRREAKSYSYLFFQEETQTVSSRSNLVLEVKTLFY
jgi:anaphase-promoting complex subunit 1